MFKGESFKMSLWSYRKTEIKLQDGEFPGGLVVRILAFYRCVLGSIPLWSGK